MGNVIPILAIICIFGIPLSAIWTNHRQKVLELQLRLKNESGGNLKNELEALRQEVSQLRDTTLQYDMSFDTALQRMETRMEGLERRVSQVEASADQQLRTGR